MKQLGLSKPPVDWLTAGILLGLVQVLAMALFKPTDVSHPVLEADAMILERILEGDSSRASDEPSNQMDDTDAALPPPQSRDPVADWKADSTLDERQSTHGRWFIVGLLAGAALVAIQTQRRRFCVTTVFSHTDRPSAWAGRLIAVSCGGVLVMLGASLAYGGLEQVLGGWTQLAVAAAPFTAAALCGGVLTARLVYPKAAGDRGGDG